MFLLLPLVPGPARAAQARPAWVIPETLNVRSGPRSESKKMGSLTRGTKVYVTAFSNKWCWCKLPSGRFGWVAEWLLQFSADKGRQIAAVSKPAASTSQLKGHPPAWINVSAANVRSGPGLGADNRGTLDQGTKVYVLARQGDWAKCKTPGGSGWIRTDLLEYDVAQGRKLAGSDSGAAKVAAKPAPSAPSPSHVRKAYVAEDKVTLRSGPGSSRDKKAALVKGQTLYVYGQKGQWVKAAVHGGTRGWVAGWLIKYDSASNGDGASKPSAGGPDVARMDHSLSAWVTADTALVRRNPSSESPAKFKLQQATKVKVAAVCGHWCKIRTASGNWGWIAGWLIKFVPPGHAVTAKEAGEKVEVKVGWVARPTVNLRSAPSTDADQLQAAALGTRLLIIGRQDDWFKVALEDGSIGWMSAKLVDTREERLIRKQVAESVTGGRNVKTAHLSAARVELPRDFPSPTAGGEGEGTGAGSSASGTGGSLISTAMRYLGCNYVSGGSGPGGFDCSGFVSYVHRRNGIDVSRSSVSLFHQGSPVARDDLQPGDVVFFERTYRAGISHVGMYIGNGKFIHAANHRGGVKITDLDSDYYASRYVGARRMY